MFVVVVQFRVSVWSFLLSGSPTVYAMKFRRSFLALLCLVGTGIACSCLRQTPRARYWRQKWVYSALVVAEESDDNTLEKR